MTFKNYYLTESLEKVYHALNVHQMIEILKNNSFELTPNVSTVETNLGGKKYYFMSTMRNKSGTYFLGVSKDTKYPMKDVYFEIDYDYLKSRMKSAPVEYWGSGRKGSEEEERFWSNDDSIGDVGKWIKKIHVLMKKDVDDSWKKHLVNLYWQAKFRKIPIVFYNDSKNYIVGKNPIEVDFENNMEFDRAKSDYVNDLEAVVKLMNDNKLNGKEVKRLKDVMRYPVYTEDFITIVTHAIHGGRKMTTSENRNYIKDFIDVMKKYKKTSVKEFIQKDVLEKMLERKLLFRN